MSRTRLSRREHARCDLVVHAFQFAGDVGKAQGEVAGDVFAEDVVGPDLIDDPGDLGPEVAEVLLPTPVAREGERLAGVTGKDDTNAATPGSTVKASKVAPDRSRLKATLRHALRESGGGVPLPLDVADGSEAGLGDVDAEVEAGIAGAEGEAGEVTGFGEMVGTKSHKACSFRPLQWRSDRGSGASRWRWRRNGGT